MDEYDKWFDKFKVPQKGLGWETWGINKVTMDFEKSDFLQMGNVSKKYWNHYLFDIAFRDEKGNLVLESLFTTEIVINFSTNTVKITKRDDKKRKDYREFYNFKNITGISFTENPEKHTRNAKTPVMTLNVEMLPEITSFDRYTMSLRSINPDNTSEGRATLILHDLIQMNNIRKSLLHCAYRTGQINGNYKIRMVIAKNTREIIYKQELFFINKKDMVKTLHKMNEWIDIKF